MTSRSFPFLILVFLLIGVGSSHADDWAQADVYFINWDTTTRVTLTPARVRELADYKHTFRNDAPAVRQLLALSKLKPAKDQRQEDARVVIDVIDDTMQRHTYYLSPFYLCSADNKLKYPIDEKFRQQITRLAKEHKTR